MELIKVLKSLGKFNELEDSVVGPETFTKEKIANMDQESLFNLENKINSNYLSEEEYLSETESPKKVERRAPIS